MKALVILIFFASFSLEVFGYDSERVVLEVPVVKQGKQLCGPATLQMIFQYWGESDYNQYDIAQSMLNQFSGSQRYIKSGILRSTPIDWSKYPGTGTINMREFLKRFGRVKNIMLENEPASPREPERLFNKVRESVYNGAPVIVHQYWSGVGSNGHYRIVTGYDDKKRVIYLNDAHGGVRVKQTYDEFMMKWNFNQRWLHYNAIFFEPTNTPLDAKL
ncbi:C39 family peptidase [Thalassolituus sp.]|uniref:C39 family peptidase n=1 Tax=Thalassolituus sp. TaxID=2030822 RepID=UPI0035186210